MVSRAWVNAGAVARMRGASNREVATFSSACLKASGALPQNVRPHSGERPLKHNVGAFARMRAAEWYQSRRARQIVEGWRKADAGRVGEAASAVFQ